MEGDLESHQLSLFECLFDLLKEEEIDDEDGDQADDCENDHLGAEQGGGVNVGCLPLFNLPDGFIEAFLLIFDPGDLPIQILCVRFVRQQLELQ